jgi:uncharacterized protein (TIGR03083 family)
MAGPREQIRTAILTAHQELLDALDAMTPEEMLLPSPNEGWTAKDTLAHLSSIEARQRSQVRSVLDGQPFPGGDVNDYNAHEVAQRRERTLPELRAELERESAATIALLDSLSEDELSREFDHPRRGRIPVSGILQTIPNHVRNHTDDIRATRKG